jgi:hypothetical protein
MAAQPLPAPTEAPRELHRELHVVPLLRSYRDAMLLARKPPPSLRLWRWLRWIHLRLRPRWACCYFTTRYVRGRVDALERALARRTALGEGDADDHGEAEAVARFKASLPPAPSRIFGVAGLIAAIVLAQVLISLLLDLVDRDSARQLKKAVGELGTSPDAQQFSDIGRVLVSANVVQLGMIVTALAATLYLFGRPLASGYRLSYLCLGRCERLGPLRRRSELCLAAARFETSPQELAAVRAASVEFRRELPIDLLVKTLPGLAIAYWLTAIARGDGDFEDVTRFQVVAWTIASIAIGAAGAWPVGRLRGRGRLSRCGRGAMCVGALVLASLAIVGDDALAGPDGIWFAFAAVVLARSGWLVLLARSRRYPVWWVVVPLALTCVLAVVASWPADL